MVIGEGASVGQGGALVAIDGRSNAAVVYLAALAPTGRRSMRGALDQVARMLGAVDAFSFSWALLQHEHVTAIRSKLLENHKPKSVNKALCAIRGVMRAAWRMGSIDAEHYQRVRDVPSVRGTTLPAGRALGPGELGALIGVCVADPSPAGARDAAIIALGYGAGLRRAELAGLDMGALQVDDGEVMTFRVMGKGSKERLIYLDGGAGELVRDWLRVRGQAAGPFFWRGLPGGRLVGGQGLTAQSVRNVVVRRARAAGVICTPHDLRRSFVSDLLDSGVDIATVAAMAGHASVQTTARYDRRGEVAKRRAARSLHVPYSRR